MSTLLPDAHGTNNIPREYPLSHAPASNQRQYALVRRIASTPEWYVTIAFVVLLGVVDTLHDFVTWRAAGQPVSAGTELVWGLRYWLPSLALVPGAVALLRAFPLRIDRPVALVVHAAAGLAFAYVHSLINANLSADVAPGTPYWTRFLIDLRFDFALNFLFYCVVVSIANMLRQYRTLQEAELRESRLQVGLTQTRLDAIESQLNPHFFFNTLQSISVMALSGEQGAVVEMLSRLSSLLRDTFSRDRPHLVSLASELDFVDGYVTLAKLSHGERLVVHTDVTPETLSACVPTMLLQPLVENAIVHGIGVTPGVGTIRIRTWRSGRHLNLEIADSGPGFPQHRPLHWGVGLASTESRLGLLFGADHVLKLGASDLGGALITISIPFAEAGVARQAPELDESPR
jgi:signal transduction histidine kinase